MATTSDLSEDGQYIWSIWVKKDRGFFGSLVIGGQIEVIATSTVFWVGTSSRPYSNAISQLQERLNDALASTTLNITTNCNPLGGSFDISNCLLGILYPGNEVFVEDLALLRAMPPWGYVFRLYDIMSDTASTSMVIFAATVPNGVPGAGGTITLDLNHSLDFILNSTSTFRTAEASSTRTFYEITSFYWDIIVYLGLAFYVLKRLLGSQLVPTLGEHNQNIR